MQKDSYISVDKPSENTIVIQKSRFITTLLPIKDYDDALEKVKAISKKYSQVGIKSSLTLFQVKFIRLHIP